MKFPIQVFLILAIFTFVAEEAFAQKQLVIDRYRKKRIRLYPGDELNFKQKDNPYLYTDVIGRLQDTVVTLGLSNVRIPISDFDSFYFPNNFARGMRISGTSVGVGFLFSAAVEPLISEAFYDPKESAIIGVSFLAASQLLRLFKWKKFMVTKNTRIRIMDTTIRAN